MKKIRNGIVIILFLSYFSAIVLKSDFWGNLLSPLVTFSLFSIVFIFFYYKNKSSINRVQGLLLSLGLLSWALADVLWAVYAMLLHINPIDVTLISILYSMTNLFITLSLTLYGNQVLRKWNVVQALLDTVVISFLIIELIWVAFLNQNIDNIILLKSDWICSSSIILDILCITWIVIWYISVRAGKLLLYLRVLFAGLLLFAITDLVYYYQYFFGKYNPNTLIDLIYIVSFLFIAVSAVIYSKSQDTDTILYNTAQEGKSYQTYKGYALLLAPVLMTLFEGIVMLHLLQCLTVILAYNFMSNYIQRNIYKEILLQQEKKYRNDLEEKVKLRTEELEEKNRILQHLLDQDFVTGLKNRRYLLSYLEKMIVSMNEGESIVLLYIDINRFKMISTMYGHYVGDMLLYEMAEKLLPMEKVAKQTILTSYGDDTFIFAAVGYYDYTHGYEFARQVINLCSDIYEIKDYQIRVTVNIGIALYPNDSSSKEELIKHADIAMSQARSQGFNYVKEFDANISKAIFRKNTIEILLKKVNFNQEFKVYFQPQLLTDSRKLIGFEALIRWRTPSDEMIGPGEFIPIAEETGYILSIGNWVMAMALKQLVEWNKNIEDKIIIGINVSLKQLNNIKFVEELKEEIERYGAKPEWIDLEITESLQLHENREMLTKLEEIRRMGVKISVDDFGTGYSSLSYFKSLPIDRIKLAKELVDNIHMDDFDYKLAEAIILLSKAKGIRVIAEGVETREQWETLKKLQCDEVQGFYFGRPESAEVIETLYYKKNNPNGFNY